MFNKITLYSPQLGREVGLHIFRPDTDGPFPVLYLHEGGLYYNGGYPGRDGQSLNFCEYYAEHADTLPGVIIVGIEPPPNRRARTAELTPFTKDFETHGADFDEHIDGRGRLLAEWIVNDLRNYINGSFPTISDREHTAIGGFSSGALNAMYCAMTYPEVFGRLQMQSPAFNLWLDELREMASHRDFSALLSWYISVGTEDSTRMTTAEQALYAARRMYSVMLEHGLQPGRGTFEIVPGGRHEPEHWRKKFPEALCRTFCDMCGENTVQTAGTR